MTGPIRILHVDDEPDFRGLIENFLERAIDEVAIESVSTADEGLDRLAEREFDCIVSDYDMPGTNGIEYLEAVREHHQHLPFILFTGKGSETVASDAISAGVTDYLQKGGPKRYQLLANRIENAVLEYQHHQFQTAMQHDPLALMDRFSDPLYALDSDWKFTYANEAAAEQFGRRREELIGRTIWEEFPEAEQTPFYEGYHGALADNEPRTIEAAFEPWDRWFRDHVHPSTDGLTIISHDVTEEKRQERELERSRELLRHAETLTDIGGWEVDARTGSQRWTEGTYRIHDLDPTGDFEPTVETGVAFYHPDDREKIASAVGRCLDDGEPYELEIRLRTDEDRLRWVHTLGEPIREDGEIVGIRGAIQDITERKDREEQLRELSQFQEAIIESANVWINVLNEDAEVVLWNEAAAQISGYSAAEVTGHDEIWEWLYPDPAYRKEVTELAAEILLGEQTAEEYETTITTKDGRTRVISWNSHQLTDVAGAFAGSVAVGRDVTERTERERELERYEEVTENVADPIYFLDARGYFDLVNQAFVDLAGVDREEIIGAHVSEFMPHEDVERGNQRIRRLLDAGGRQWDSFEMRFQPPDGEARISETKFTVLTDDGEFTGSVGVIRDIEARKEHERLLEEFASVVSHDLRNPLTIAAGRLELAREECQSDHLAHVGTALDRMAALIADLLEVAREGKAVRETAPVDLAALATTVWDHLETGEAQLVVETDRTIEADESRLRQLLTNLFRNAIEHGETTTQVVVADRDGGFTVEDDGRGIPPAERDRSFEMGYSTGNGAGLGLAIVRQIATGHGWTVRIADGADSGTRFAFTNVEVVA